VLDKAEIRFPFDQFLSLAFSNIFPQLALYAINFCLCIFRRKRSANNSLSPPFGPNDTRPAREQQATSSKQQAATSNKQRPQLSGFMHAICRASRESLLEKNQHEQLMLIVISSLAPFAHTFGRPKLEAKSRHWNLR